LRSLMAVPQKLAGSEGTIGRTGAEGIEELYGGREVGVEAEDTEEGGAGIIELV